MTDAPSTPDEPDAPADIAPPATNVIQAIARVLAEIGGIRKMTAADRERMGIGGGEKGVQYAYRGIDQLASAAQPLLGKHGIVIVPRVTSRETVPVTVGGNPWTDTIVLVEWTIYGPGGVDDCIISVTEGWGRDNSDKGINKAMTGAFKNLLLRLLVVGDPQDDTDGHTFEADAGEPPPPPLSPEQERAAMVLEEAAQIVRKFNDLPDDDKAAFSRWKAEHHSQQRFTAPYMANNPAWMTVAGDKINELDAGFGGDDPADPTVPAEPVAIAADPVPVSTSLASAVAGMTFDDDALDGAKLDGTELDDRGTLEHDEHEMTFDDDGDGPDRPFAVTTDPPPGGDAALSDAVNPSTTRRRAPR